MPLQRTLTSLFATLVVLAGVSVSAPAHAADPIRILAAGDSITQGFHGDYTWRYRLYKEFERQGVPADFVGSRRDVTQSAGWAHSEYADPNFDREHFAWAGVTLRVMASWIGAEVDSQDPDLLVLAAGVNDLRAGLTAQETNASLRRAIANARSAKPRIRILVAPVLDARDPSRPALSSAVISTYNSLARSTVSGMSTSESPVTWADTTRGWQLTQYTIEDLHPNPTGETHIGQRVGEALHALGVLPSPPQIFRILPWPRISAITAKRSGTRVHLTWSWQGTTGSRVMMTRVGAPGIHYRWVHGGALTTAALPPGVHTFRVQLMRGRTTGSYGAVARVTIPRGPAPAPVARVVVDKVGAHWSRSSLATSYIVKFRAGNKRRWVTRSTTGLHLFAPRMKRARVWAVNASGRSPMRAGAR